MLVNLQLDSPACTIGWRRCITQLCISVLSCTAFACCRAGESIGAGWRVESLEVELELDLAVDGRRIPGPRGRAEVAAAHARSQAQQHRKVRTG